MTVKNSYLWESGHEGAFIVLKFSFQQMNARKQVNIQGDRKLHGLSEYVITLKRMWLYSEHISKIQSPTIFFRGYKCENSEMKKIFFKMN